MIRRPSGPLWYASLMLGKRLAFVCASVFVLAGATGFAQSRTIVRLHGQPICTDVPCTPVESQLIAIANRLTQPMHAARFANNAAYVQWLNGPYRQRVARDRHDRREFDTLLARMHGPRDEMLRDVLLTLVTDAQFRNAGAADAANPANAMMASGGIGADQVARSAHQIVALANACVTSTSAAGAAWSRWSARCRTMATEYTGVENESCAALNIVTGGPQSGTYCGDRPH